MASLSPGAPLVILAALAAFAPAPAGPAALPRAQTWWVDVHAAPPGAGTQGSPYASIQYAIDQPGTSSGDTLLVLPGTYHETVDFRTKSLIVESTEGALSTVIDASSCVSGPFSACSTVRITGGQVAPTRLEGFTLRGGQGTSLQPGHPLGGNLFIQGANARIVACVIRDGFASDGGGIYCEASRLLLERCVLVENGIQAPGSTVLVTAYGGGLYLRDSAASMHATRILRNNSTRAGAGFFVRGGTLEAEQCLVEGNFGLQSIGEGGGGYLLNADVTLRSSRFVRNRTGFEGYGGALHNQASSLALEECTFEDNESWWRGGGAIYGSATASKCVFRGNRGEIGGAVAGSGSYDSCSFFDNVAYGTGGVTARGGAVAVNGTMQLVRCIFAGNTCGPSSGGAPPAAGGAVGAAPGSTAILVKCTLVGNVSVLGSGGAVSSCTVRSSILRGNVPDQAQASSVDYSNIEGNHAGVGNLDADPLFWDPPLRDFHLMAGSPSIDSGDPADGPDPDGSPPDQGALPFDPGYCPKPRAYCVSTTNGIGCAPTLASSGSASLTGADDFLVTAAHLTNLQLGQLVWSFTAASIPFAGGTLCIAPPLVRTLPQGSGGNAGGPDCSGTFGFHLTQAAMAAHGLQPGTVLHAQYWMRDPQDPSGHNASLSNALRFLICP